jgi:hypothetical protein
MQTRNEVDIAAAGLPHPAILPSRPRVVVCMTNHERPDCARINQEIIKLNYPEPWLIVHACSDPDYQPHREDALVRCQPRTIIYGALNLLQQSCRAAVEIYNPQYLVHVEADTWVFDQGIIQRYIDLLDRNPQAYLAASTWSTDQRPQWRRLRNPFAKAKLGVARLAEAVGNDFYVKRKQTLSTQFFIARNDPRFFTMMDGIQPTIENTLEYDFYQAFVREFGAGALIKIKEREPVHPLNRHWCPALTLHAQHWPEQLPRPADLPNDGVPRQGVSGQYDIPGKKEVLAAYGFKNIGPAMRQLLDATDTSYYNPKAKRY